jgi:hypothetical protein
MTHPSPDLLWYARSAPACHYFFLFVVSFVQITCSQLHLLFERDLTPEQRALQWIRFDNQQPLIEKISGFGRGQDR